MNHGFLLGCIILAGCVRMPTPQQPVMDMSPGASEWAANGPMTTLGRQVPYSEELAVPSALIRSARTHLAGKPAEWRVQAFTNEGRRIVCLTDTQRHHLVYLVLPERWVLLSHPDGLKYINELLESYLNLPGDWDNPSRLGGYIEEVAYCYRGPYRAALSTRWLKAMEQTFGEPEPILYGWLGKERNPDALRSLCAGPTVKVQGSGVEIQCNVITSRGSVENWVLHGKLGKSLMLTGIAVSIIREEGTFFYASSPSD